MRFICNLIVLCLFLMSRRFLSPTGSSGAQLAAGLAGRSSGPPGWAAMCTASIENKKDGQQYFICLGQKQILGEPCSAVDGSLSSHTKSRSAFRYGFAFFKGEVCARRTKKGRRRFEELAFEASIS